MEETKLSAPLLYPNLSSSEQSIKDKILADNKFINNINIIKNIRSYYDTETNNYNKKLCRYKNYINVAEITEKLLSSIATTTASTSAVAIKGIGLPYSIPTAFVTATVCGSLSKTINTKIRNKIMKYSQMCILSKQFGDKFNTLYTKPMNENKRDNDEYNELVKVYEEYKRNEKNKLGIFWTKFISV